MNCHVAYLAMIVIYVDAACDDYGRLIEVDVEVAWYILHSA
jgi:hypothetical protein